MNIEDLTLRQIREIQALTAPCATPLTPSMQHSIGDYVIVRCKDAGVHAGVLVAVEGDTLQLQSARRLWKWHAKSGVALSGLATSGLGAGKDNKIDALTDITLRGWCEIIPATVAQASIEAAA